MSRRRSGGHYDLMAAIMRRAVEDALIPRSLCRSVELLAVIAREKRYLTEDEVESLVEAVEPRYRALVYTAAYLRRRRRGRRSRSKKVS